MYRFVFLILLILPAFELMAQHVPLTPIRTDFTTLYKGDEMYKIRIDSIRANGSDTIFYVDRVIKEEAGLPGNCTYNTNDTSWIGTHFVQKPNYDYLFFNRDGDTIFIQFSFANFGDTFTVYKFPNGNRVIAEIVDIQYIPVVNTYDNNRFFELSVINAAGNPVKSGINGMTFTGSYLWGFTQIPDWYNFPYDTTEIITLAGVQDTMAGNINAYRIFSHHLGQEFHYETTYATCGFTGCRTEFSLEKLFIIAKDSAQNGDSLYYSFRRNMITYIDDPVDGLDTTYVVDTISTAIYLPDFAHLDTLTRELFFWNGNPGFAITSFTDSTGPRARKELILDVDYHPGDNCLEDVNLGNPRYIYGDSLGLTYFYDDTGGVSTYERELIYYKKGIEQWGNPIDFDVLLRVPEIDRLKFSAHLSDKLLHLTLEEKHLPAKFALINLQGQVVINGAVTHRTTEIDVSALPTGIYLVQIQVGRLRSTTKLVK